ncbi:MAG TPA: TorF family putative porin [Pseudomonadales bacterium]
MNRLTSIVFGAALMSSALVASAAEIAGNVTLATDYRFRGISQVNGGFSPAIQGGFDLATDAGFYIGTWSSNIKGTEGAIETDIYGGFKGMFSDDLGYDIGVLYYGYPQDGAAHDGYTEVYGSLSWKGAKFGVNYSDNYFAGSGEFLYPYVDFGFDPMENVTLSFHYGYNSFDEKQAGLNNEDYYQDWKAAISTKQLGVNWALAYVDTDLDNNRDCYGNKQLCEATAVFSISKSL